MSALLKSQMEESSTKLEADSARNNAMLGLQIALGELQRYAGPDQRTTATADILSDSTTTNAEEYYFTGVWNSADPDPTNVAITDPITGLNKGDFIRWLVSQNPSNPLPVNLNGSGYSGDISLVIDQDDSNTTTVEVEKISAPSSLGSGNYAYWVGDDGVKAKANLPIKDKNISYGITTFEDWVEGSQVLFASPRYGIEHFHTTDYAKYKESLDSINANRQDFQSLMKRIISKDQVQLIDTATNKFAKINDTFYHDFTTHSMGLLTNTKDGGLKEDLSLAFEHGTKGSLDNPVLPAAHKGKLTNNDRFVYTIQNYLHPYGNGAVTGPGLIRVRGPRWDILQEHYNLHKTLKAYAITETQPTLNSQFGNPGGLIDDDVNKQGTYMADSIASPNPDNDWRAWFRDNHWTTDPAVLNIQMTNGGGRTIWPLEIPRAHSTRLNPVPLVTTHTYSFYSPPVGTNGAPVNTIQIIGNPMILLWNPYNIRLKFDVNDPDVLDPAYAVSDSLKFEFKGASLSATVPQTGNGTYQSKNGFSGAASFGNGATGMSIPKALLDFQPGELILFTANNDATNTGDAYRTNKILVAQKGYNPNGGWIWEKLDPTGAGTFLTCTGDFTTVITSGGFRISDFRVDGSDFYAPHYSGNREQSYSKKFAWGNNTWFYNKDESIVHNITLLAGQNIFPFASYFDRMMAPDDVEPAVAMLAPFERPPEIWMHSNLRSFLTRSNHSTIYNHYRPMNMILRVEELDGTGILPFDLSGPNGYFGASYSASSGYKQMASWDIPRSPLLSMAQLQHAHTQSWFWEPSYPTGNSYASPYIDRDKTISTVAVNQNNTGSAVDISYLMNETLWDGYYFSSLSPRYEKNGFGAPVSDFYDLKTIAIDNDLDQVIDEFSQSNSTNNVLRNPRMTYYRSDNKTDAQIATLLKIDAPTGSDIYGSKSAPAFMMVDGGFNINSTSINAWKALLSGLNEIKVPVLNTDLDSTTDTISYSVANKNVFSRSSLPLDTLGDSNEPTDVDPANDHWEGFRSLTDQHITDLATNIVAEIKARGPAFTLADFINRKLTLTGDHWKSGAIQSAIDTTNVVNVAGSVGTGINGEILLNNPDKVLKVKVGGLSYTHFLEPHAKTGYTDGLGTADTALQGFTIGGAPGYLMQADILNSIGPFLNNRSNTFTIRSYGDSTDIHGQITSKAYLEAVVQQVTDFVDSTDIATTNMASISTTNQTFGRKFKIVSYKWINESDL